MDVFKVVVERQMGRGRLGEHGAGWRDDLMAEGDQKNLLVQV